MSANKRRRQKKAEEVVKQENVKEVDPRGIQAAFIVGVRNDGTPFVDVTGNMNLFEIGGALKYAEIVLEDLWLDKLDKIKEIMAKEAKEAQKHQEQARGQEENGPQLRVVDTESTEEEEK